MCVVCHTPQNHPQSLAHSALRWCLNGLLCLRVGFGPMHFSIRVHRAWPIYSSHRRHCVCSVIMHCGKHARAEVLSKTDTQDPTLSNMMKASSCVEFARVLVASLWWSVYIAS